MCLGATAEFEQVRRHHVAQGHFLPPFAQVTRGDRMCCLGSNVARELFRGANPVGEAVHIGGRRFRVAGVMESKGRQQGFDLDELVYISEPAARKLFNLQGYNRILVQVSSLENQDRVCERVKSVLTARHKGVEDFTLLTGGSVLESLDRIVAILSAVLTGIAAVSLVVGGIGIANVALVATTARTEEVGIKKALGAHPAWILVQFLCESVITGSLGGALGAAIAWLVTLAARLVFPALPLETPLWSIAHAACAA
jgi:putative ABC transport system permease protein